MITINTFLVFIVTALLLPFLPITIMSAVDTTGMEMIAASIQFITVFILTFFHLFTFNHYEYYYAYENSNNTANNGNQSNNKW